MAKIQTVLGKKTVVKRKIAKVREGAGHGGRHGWIAEDGNGCPIVWGPSPELAYAYGVDKLDRAEALSEIVNSCNPCSPALRSLWCAVNNIEVMAQRW